MSDNDKQAEQSDAQERHFAIQRVYLKDVSFETPNSPAMFTVQWQPSINIELASASDKLGDDVYEVVLTLTVTCKAEEKTAYLVEVQQAGIFTIAGFDEVTHAGMLGSYCPNILFPYAREAISSLVNKGSFPQLLLAPVNFDALYAQHLEQQQAQNSTEQESQVH
ncbi:MAG: protein-export chaperone SecB [Thiohalomonadaceae bacterium]|jgi:preprotein translocase subunit SecB